MSDAICFSCGAEPATDRCPHRCIDTGLTPEEADELRAELASARAQLERMEATLEAGRVIADDNARMRGIAIERDDLRAQLELAEKFIPARSRTYYEETLAAARTPEDDELCDAGPITTPDGRSWSACELPKGHPTVGTSHLRREIVPAREAVSAATPEQDSGSPTGSVVEHGSVGGASEDVSK